MTTFPNPEFSAVTIKIPGVAGDGATDVTAGLQAWLDAAHLNHGIRDLPSGIYIISSTLFLSSGTLLRGMGYSSVIQQAAVWLSPNNTMITNTGVAVGGWFITPPTSVHDIYIETLAVKNDASSPIGLGMQLITMFGVQRSHVRGCCLTGGSPVSHINVTDALVDDCDIFMATGAVSPWWGSTRCRYTNLRIAGDPDNVGGSAIAVNAADIDNTHTNLVTSDIEIDNVNYIGDPGVNAAFEIFPIGSGTLGNSIQNVRITNCYAKHRAGAVQSALVIGGNVSDVTVTNFTAEDVQTGTVCQISIEDSASFYPKAVNLYQFRSIACAPGAHALLNVDKVAGLLVAGWQDRGSTYSQAFLVQAPCTGVTLVSNDAPNASSQKYALASATNTTIIDSQGITGQPDIGGGFTIQSGGAYLNLKSAGGEVVQLNAQGTSANFFLMQSAPAGSVVNLSAVGGDANVSMTLTPKGSGTIIVAGPLRSTGAFAANGNAVSGKIVISGSRGGATATVLESLLQAMQTFGLITDSTSA